MLSFAPLVHVQEKPDLDQLHAVAVTFNISLVFTHFAGPRRSRVLASKPLLVTLWSTRPWSQIVTAWSGAGGRHERRH